MANKLSADFQYFVSTCFEEINQVRILSALSVVYQFGDIVCVFDRFIRQLMSLESREIEKFMDLFMAY